MLQPKSLNDVRFEHKRLIAANCTIAEPGASKHTNENAGSWIFIPLVTERRKAVNCELDSE